MQATRLASEAIKMVKQKQPEKPKKILKGFVAGTTKILVGIPLMKRTANLVESY